MEFNQLSRVRKLYKTILKLHRGLPEHVKTIGDIYTRDEFKKHKNCKPQEESIFIEEWTVNIRLKKKNLKKYAILLSQQLGLKGPKTARKLGMHLTNNQLDSMSDDQIQTMYELMMETQGKETQKDNK